MSFILIYITHENLTEAKKIANHLLEKKLVACANFFPIESMYWWKGKIQNTNEVVSIIKTKTENWEKVKTAVKELHPYECPCIMKINAQANQDYEDWINKETE